MTVINLGKPVTPNRARRGRRWKARVFYSTPRQTKTLNFDEFHELGDMIEDGPDWNEIERIEVVLCVNDVTEAEMAYAATKDKWPETELWSPEEED